ncbi:hypothetical protein TURU_149283 [Turdus rufiventris]|nr:hypothetical protein TURU_149283 [Turdus rufiventris]
MNARCSRESSGHPSGIQRDPSGMFRESIGNPSGIQQESIGNPSGIQRESIRNASGIQQEFIGIHQESTGNPLGIHRESIRNPSGIQQESIGNPAGIQQESIGNPLGIHQESIGNPLGIQQESIGIHQESIGNPSGIHREAAPAPLVSPCGDKREVTAHPAPVTPLVSLTASAGSALCPAQQSADPSLGKARPNPAPLIPILFPKALGNSVHPVASTAPFGVKFIPDANSSAQVCPEHSTAPPQPSLPNPGVSGMEFPGMWRIPGSFQARSLHGVRDEGKSRIWDFPFPASGTS